MAEAKGDEAEFLVLRAHEGDKSYLPGDTRVAREIDVQHLVGKTLQKKGDRPVEPEPEPAPKKSEPKVKG